MSLHAPLQSWYSRSQHSCVLVYGNTVWVRIVIEGEYRARFVAIPWSRSGGSVPRGWENYIGGSPP